MSTKSTTTTSESTYYPFSQVTSVNTPPEQLFVLLLLQDHLDKVLSWCIGQQSLQLNTCLIIISKNTVIRAVALKRLMLRLEWEVLT